MQNIQEFTQSRERINWRDLFIITSFHVLLIPAFFYFSWTNLAIMLVGNWIVGSFGVDKNGEVFGVLDVDSDELDDFSEIDAEGLKEIVKIIEHLIN